MAAARNGRDTIAPVNAVTFPPPPDICLEITMADNLPPSVLTLTIT